MVPKYPNITVKLTGTDGNAYAIIGRVNNALIAAGIDKDERDLFKKEAMQGNYDQVIVAAFQWVNID